MKNELKYALAKLVEFCETNKTEAFIVGGFVRDVVMGCSPKDIDIVVRGDYRTAARAFADSLGKNCVGFHADPKTAKVLIIKDANVTEVDITSMTGQCIEEDLRRRDFTMNAMAMPVAEALTNNPTVIDPFDAKRDIASQEIRLTGDSVLGDDPIRCLRAVRLSIQKNMRIERRTEMAIREHAHLLEGVPGERVQAEISAILDTQEAARGVRMLDELDLLEVVLPELTAGRNVTQPADVHAYDVLEHCIQTLTYVEVFIDSGQTNMDIPAGYYNQPVGHWRLRQVIKLAALLHDIGKAETRSWDETAQRVRFIGHDETGAAQVKGIAKRLRLGNDLRDLLVNMVANHMHPHHLVGGRRDPSPKAIRKYYRRTGSASKAILLLGMADYLGGRGNLLDQDLWNSYVAGVQKVDAGVAEHIERIKEPLLTGKDVLTLGMTEGPAVGLVLRVIDEAHESGDLNTREQAIEMARGIIEEVRC